MPSVLRIGSRVSGCVGPFVPVAMQGPTNESGKRARRTRERHHGIIIESVSERTWKVLWDETGQTSEVKGQVLRLEGTSGLSQLELIALQGLNNSGTYMSSTSTPTQAPLPFSNQERTNPSDEEQRQRESQSSSQGDNCPGVGALSIGASPNNQGTQETDGTLIDLQRDLYQTNNLLSTLPSDESDDEPEQEEDPDAVPDEDVRLQPAAEAEGAVNPNFDAEGQDSHSHHLARMMKYQDKKETLFGKKIRVGPRSMTEANKVEWTVRHDMKESEIKQPPPPEIPPKKVGVIGFDFSKHREHENRTNLLDLIIHLWPGCWRTQLANINEAIERHNKEQEQGFSSTGGKRRRIILPSGQYKRTRKVRKVSEHEFWVFFGLLLFARLFGRVGEIWDRESKKREGYRPAVDASRHMTEYRFDQIRQFVPMMWADETKKDSDDWWKISKLFDDFNINQRETLSMSDDQVLDEFMSAFRPQTRGTGNLPHISFIQRKPEPLGTEGKCRADPVLEMFSFVELQRGKMPMRQAEFTQEHGGTTACVLRHCKNIAPRRLENVEISDFPYERRVRVFGDSWFASVKTTVELWKKFGIMFVGVVKTAHSKFPKAYLEKTMQEWPAGSHLVLEAVIDDVDVLAVGYKYNARKVICFVMHKQAGDTELTDAYEAKWKDAFNNTLSRSVPRPTVIGEYFRLSNTVDCHNEMRQFFLKLEKHWVTTDGYFRIITTFFGIVITDAWHAYRHHMAKNHRHRHVGIIDFADMLLKDCLENRFTLQEPEEIVLHIPAQPRDDTLISSLTPASSITAGDRERSLRQTMTAETLLITQQDQQSLSASFSRNRTMIEAAASATATTNESGETFHHGDVEVNDSAFVVTDSKKKRVYTRTRRGKCSVCKKLTRFYCLKCEQMISGDPSLKRRWLCGKDTSRGCSQQHRSLF